MTTTNYGRTAGFFSTGEVKDRMDPTQSGLLRVNWNIGGANQDTLGKEELPWSKVLYNSSDPALKQTGGPHVGLREGSKVFGFSLDGQDWVILGSIVQGGKGEPDSNPTYDSDIPRPAKSQQVDGPSYGVDPQPRYGDVNDIVTQDSIVKYAQDQGGPDKNAAKFADLKDPIGTLANAIV